MFKCSPEIVRDRAGNGRMMIQDHKIDVVQLNGCQGTLCSP